MKNNHSIKKAMLTAFAFFGVLAGSAFTSVSATGNSGVFLKNRKNALDGEQAIDPSEYEEVSTAHLIPKITSYTSTSLSRHLNVQFESQVMTAFKTGDNDVFYVIDDPRYTGERSNPFAEEVPDKTFNGFVHAAEAASTTQTKLYVSNSIGYGSSFTIKATKIVANAMYKDVDTAYDAYKNLTEIYICDGIEEIESGAFVDVPAGVTFKCLAASKPAGWADDWTDAPASQIQWGQELDDASKLNVKHRGSVRTFGDAEDYILGYKGNESLNIGAYPLTMSYKKTKADGSEATEYQVIPTKHQTNPYDAIGSKIYGKSNSFEITIDLEKGEHIDDSSYEFYNIFKAQRYYTDIKVSWPTAQIEKIFEQYRVPTKSSEDDALIPSLEGDGFFYQEFETTTDKYISIAKEFDDETAASELEATFKANVEAIDVDKDILNAKENFKYAVDTSFAADKYGNVYVAPYETETQKTNAFVQFYVYFNERTTKYEFVSYFVLDNPTAEVKTDEEGHETTTYVNTQSPFPIVSKQEAVRPFIYVPEYVEEGGVKLPKEKMCSKAVSRYSHMTDIAELFNMKYRSSSKFLNYISIGMTVDKLLETAYAGYIAQDDGTFDKTTPLKAFLKGEDGKYYAGSTVYEANQVLVEGQFKAPARYIAENSSRLKIETNLSAVLNGEIQFRYTLSNLNSSKLVISYRDGQAVKTAELPIKSPSPVIELGQEKNNIVSFMVNASSIGNIDAKNILALGVSGMTVNIHLYNKKSHAVVQNTQLLNVFGNVEVLPLSDKDLGYFDINLYLVLFYVALTVGYAAIAVILFFYKKNKYKNDEFRRMKPKAYVKSAVLGYVGLALISAAINFVVLRFGVFNSTVPTFNPIDAFVIGFVIAGAIALGLFIKNGAAAIKLMKHRMQVKKLHLDKDVVDDGTH